MSASSTTLAPPADRQGRLRQFLVTPIGAQLTAIVTFVILWQLVTVIAPRVAVAVSTSSAGLRNAKKTAAQSGVR